MATAHGAGLMLLPFMIGLCTSAPAKDDTAPAAQWLERGHAAITNVLAQSGTATALAVATAHTLAMMAAALAMPGSCTATSGCACCAAFWFNLDRVWGASLVVAGAAGAAMAL